MTIDESLRRIKTDGWCVIGNVIPDDDVASVRDSIISTLEKAEASTSPETSMRVARGSLINLDQSIAPFVSDPRILGVFESLWGQYVKITITTPVVNLPGNSGSGWHSDWPFNQKHPVKIPAPYPDTPILMTVIFMLVDFTPLNGGTKIVPGSHRIPHNWTSDFGEDSLSAHPSEVQVTGKAGSVLIFDSRMWHQVQKNHTDEARAGVTVRYSPWWLNLNPLVPGSPEREYMLDENGDPEANVRYPLPREVYDSLPERSKPLFRHWVRE